MNGLVEPATMLKLNTASSTIDRSPRKPRPGAMNVLHQRVSRCRRNQTTIEIAARACRISTARVPKPSMAGTSVSIGLS